MADEGAPRATPAVALVTSRNLVRAADAVPAHRGDADVQRRHDARDAALEEESVVVWDAGGVGREENVEDIHPARCGGGPSRKRPRRSRDAGRNEIVQALLAACGVLERVRVVEPRIASMKEASALHEESYLQLLGAWEGASREELEAYNLVDDAAPFAHVAQHALWIAGASLQASSELTSGRARVAVNLCGGRHHASSRRASGFCYINDVVLAAQDLQKHFGRVMVVDIDVHHGDGTERAFLYSNKVLTISFHQREPGFFPGTGAADSRGKGKGQGFTVNVPFTHRATRADFAAAFEAVIRERFASFEPKALVLVCGVDALKSDPRGGLSLEADDIVACARTVRELCSGEDPLPLLVTGAGGYDFAAAAKAWTRVVAELADAHDGLPTDVPEHEFFELYGPSWRLR